MYIFVCETLVFGGMWSKLITGDVIFYIPDGVTCNVLQNPFRNATYDTITFWLPVGRREIAVVSLVSGPSSACNT